MGAAARTRRGSGDPAELGGSAENRTGLSLPGAAPSRGSGVDFVRVEIIRSESPGEVLPAKRGWKKATGGRAVEMEAAGQDHSPRDAARIGQGANQCGGSFGDGSSVTQILITRSPTTWPWRSRRKFRPA